MAAKQTNVTLSNGNVAESFPIEHAERLLGLRGTAWMLADGMWKYDGERLNRVAKSKEGK